MGAKQFWKSGEPLFDNVCDIYAKTAGEPMKQAMQLLRNSGFDGEASNAIEWLKEQHKRLSDVCRECSGDCMNCGIMPVSIEIEEALQ